MSLLQNSIEFLNFLLREEIEGFREQAEKYLSLA
jgi:hypothetical protein